MTCKFIIKRNGKKEAFDESKLRKGVLNSFIASGLTDMEAADLADIVCNKVTKMLDSLGFDCTTASSLQENIITALQEQGHYGEKAAWAFADYANKRRDMREMAYLRNKLDDITFKASKDSDMKRENANIDGDTAMGTMLRYGSESAKAINLAEQVSPDIAEAHKSGDIHIHDLDFLSLTETCCQINLKKLFKGGFSTGHGFIREPESIQTAASLACIAIQSNQNDQHGGQAVPCFDFYMAPYVTKTAVKEAVRCICDAKRAVDYVQGKESPGNLEELTRGCISAYLLKDKSLLDNMQLLGLAEFLANSLHESIEFFMKELTRAASYTEKATYQAMEALVHNLNTMNSRAGAQVPFSSLNFGTDISPEGRCVSRNLMQAIYDGLGNGETPIFPITIFKVKKGVNFNPGDPNYDLYQQALKTTAKRLFPNFSFVDAPFNLQYYKKGHPETEVAYMGCRTRVMGNVYDTSREITEGRGNLSFTTINLPRLGIRCKGNIDKFYEMLDEVLDLTRRQLLERFKIQCNKKVRNYPFLMGQGVWIDSDKLHPDDKVEDVLKHGTLTIGFIGLAECLVAICGKHQGESEIAQSIGLGIVGHMREYTDKLCKETGLNWGIIATPAEGLSGRFVKIDRKLYGEIPGVTDKDWYTNSFHVPVEYPISAFKKLAIEGPYHKLTNGGHISYVEIDGNASMNIEALDQIVRRMADCGVGYGAINHPVDRDPVCGYTGVINDVCPLCRRKENEMADTELLAGIKRLPESYDYTLAERGLGVPFERIRRITGYLVGTVDRFNDAKRDELEHRVKHL